MNQSSIWLLGLIVLMDVFALKVAKDQSHDAKKTITTNQLWKPKVKDQIPADTVKKALQVKFVGPSRVKVRNDTVDLGSGNLSEHLRPHDSARLTLTSAQRSYLDVIGRLQRQGMKILVPVDPDGSR